MHFYEGKAKEIFTIPFPPVFRQGPIYTLEVKDHEKNSFV